MCRKSNAYSPDLINYILESSFRSECCKRQAAKCECIQQVLELLLKNCFIGVFSQKVSV